jgi:hypothetical protein
LADEEHQVLKGVVSKVDTKLGLVFGWGIICTEKNAAGDFEDHYDLQGDHIPVDVMIESTSDFMLNSREAHDMHKGSRHGAVVHSMPMTREIAKAFGVEADREGWMIAMKPSPAVLQKFESGEYRGFSIGGGCTYDLEAV